MKIRLLALFACVLSLRAQDAPAPAGSPLFEGKIEIEIDGKKETLDFADPATAQRLKGKVIITTEINGQRETRVVNAEEADHLPAPFLWNEKPPVRTGPVTFLGVGAVEVPADVAAQLTLPQDTGLQVAIVLPDSPAAKAGLQESDVIQKFEDQILVTPRQFAVLIANRKEGDAVKLSILRKGQPMEITATLGKRDMPHAAESPDAVAEVKREMWKLPDGAGIEGDVTALRESASKLHTDRQDALKDPRGMKHPVPVTPLYKPITPKAATATGDTGKALRRALDRMPAEQRTEIEQLLRDYDVLPKNKLPPAK